MNEYNDIDLPADFDDLSKHAPLLEELRSKGDGFAVPENYFSETSELVNAKTTLPDSTGFAVPENYFEDLAERILAVVQFPGKENPFSVPENYFGNFADEIASVASLHELKNQEGFELPENYFSELESTLETKLALDNLKQDEGFSVPDGYFEKLTGQIIARAAVDELQNGSDADVPEGYFDSLADRISARIAEEEGGTKEETQERGRVIVFAEIIKRYSRPVALAASAALLIAVSTWFLNRGNENGTDQPITKIDTVTKSVPQVVPQPKTNEVIASQEPKKDSVVAKAPKQIIAYKPKKENKTLAVNQTPIVPVKVEKQDVIDQMYLLDENAVAEALSQANTEAPANEDIDAIQNELMIDMSPDLFDGGMIQKK